MSRDSAGLVCVLAVVPLCSYVRVECLQGVAFTSSPPGTEWTARLVAAGAIHRRSRPAVLLPCWALDAEPENVLVASQPDAVGIVSLSCITYVIPLGQERVIALCKSWMPYSSLGHCAHWATIHVVFADPRHRCGAPLVTTDITTPTTYLTAVCYQGFRCTTVRLIVPLSCHLRSLGDQRVVLACFAATALRTTIAIAPVTNNC